MTARRCGLEEQACACLLPEGHDDFHECECGGRWRFVDGVFEVVRWPQIIMEGPQAGERTPWADAAPDDILAVAAAAGLLP